VIGRSNYFGFGFVFRQSFENRSITGGFHLMSPPPSWGTEQKRKKLVWEFHSIFMQNMSHYLLLFSALSRD